MFNNVQAAVAAGVNAAFFSGDTCWGVIPILPSSAGVSHRVISRIGQFGPIDERLVKDFPEIARFTHGTTVATNAVLERKGARIGIITTEGFRDVLEIGRQMRHEMYKLALEAETPAFLAPGARRKEARERVAADGSVLVPLDEASVRSAADELVADGVEAIAICFLFSFRNPAHEIRARALDEMDEGELLAERDALDRERDRAAHRAHRARLHAAVVHPDHHTRPGDEADPGDQGGAGDRRLLLRGVNEIAGERVEPEERHPGIEQPGQPLPRGQLSARLHAGAGRLRFPLRAGL